MTSARARAHSNIALIKYWGKASIARNMPAVPSLSMTLDALFTETEIELVSEATSDRVFLDDEEQTGRPKERVVALLNGLRKGCNGAPCCVVRTSNNFPTAAGLASSASGFAALAVAANAAYNLDLSRQELSSVARLASASAARSLFGGFAELDLDQESAAPVASALDLRLFVAVTQVGPKAIGSTDAMLKTKETSPYYQAWVRYSPKLFTQAKRALASGDFTQLGQSMEHSTLMMHASMMAADPGIIYQTGTSLTVIQAVRQLQREGIPAYFTMDAGPHVKVFTPSQHAARVKEQLAKVPGVIDLLACKPGPEASVLEQVR